MSRHERILGLGSPHGDDQVGWLLIERLQARSSLPAQAIAIKSGFELLDYVEGCRRLLLVDGCLTGAPPGKIGRLEWPAASLRYPHRRSTHDVDVGGALELARRLGMAPTKVVFWGVEIENCHPGAALSPAVWRALPELERRVLDELVQTAGKS